ncbi:AtpZ/AtpI family protein [uncultured Winogradskyella sp.]|uniref:AtpZ/AtpI family protein n=1 Tax=uncultured Winogradskyella sp. TaxID=395353 RepID=UPI0030DAAD75
MTLLKPKQNKHSKNQKNKLSAYAKYSSIGFQMFAIIGIGTFLGVKLDAYYSNNNNLCTIILSLISVIISIVYVIKRIIADSKDN